jgi:hypothetical protein
MKEDEIEENFIKALLVTIGYLTLLTLLVFIPLVGWILALTFGAYVAGYRGGRYSVDWRRVGLLAAVIWSTVIVLLILWGIISFLPMPLKHDLVIGGIEIAIICVPFAFNIVFCVLGAKARFKERSIYI